MLQEETLSKESQFSEIIISLSSIATDEKSVVEEDQRDSRKATIPHSTSQKIRYGPPRHSKLHKITHEGIVFFKVYVKVRVGEVRDKRSYNALTTAGRFNHYLVDPLAKWHGLNDRILASASLAQVEIVSPAHSVQRIINGSSHNYAGLYSMCEEDLELHRTCLERLPIADVRRVTFLHEKMLEGLAEFWNGRCCFSTSTGYESNLLGIPAIAEKGWLILLDEKSHNSVFTACYMANVDAIKKFKHNDMKELESLLEVAKMAAEYAGILVIIEGLYSMDGTIPPLGTLYQLKQKYSFSLYVDEAHSFGSIGKTGRGILELWNDEHPDDTLPLELIDVRSAVLSKAVGGIGGFVCATSNRFEEALRRRSKYLQQQSGGSLTTSTMLQTLSFLAQNLRLTKNLSRLRDISNFCHEELKRHGVFVYSDENLCRLPILPVFGGRPSKAAELSHALRKFGVLAAPVSTPAVNVWESRVRVILSPSYTDADVNGLLAAIITASRQTGLSKRSKNPRRIYCSRQDPDAGDVKDEKIEAFKHLRKLLNEQIHQTNMGAVVQIHNQTVIDAGLAAQQQYGIASGGARWVIGTFKPHLRVEEMIAEITNQPSALTYPDSHLGLMSTIAASCRPILGAKKHYFLLPADAPAAVEEGLRIASTKSGTVSIRYSDLNFMLPLFIALAARRDTYITLYIQPLQHDQYIDLTQMAVRLHDQLPRSYRGCTILIDDTRGFGRCGTQKLGFGRSANFGRVRNLLSARILITGSFSNAFGLPGGWLAGSSELIEEFRFTSRCYMFTTSPMPFVMAMIKQSLQSLLQ